MIDSSLHDRFLRDVNDQTAAFLELAVVKWAYLKKINILESKEIFIGGRLARICYVNLHSRSRVIPLGDTMLAYPQELKYVKTHEYIQVDGDIATIGITAFAADQLGDVTYVELPGVGDKFKVEQKFGVIESVKSVSDLFMPVSGEITEINEQLVQEPELVNLDCYGKGWMIKVKLEDKGELDTSMSSEQYKEFVVE